MIATRNEIKGAVYYTPQKISLLLRVLMVLIITIGLMVLVRLIEEDFTQALVDAVFLAVAVVGYLRLKKDRSSYKAVIRIIFISAIIASMLLLKNHPELPIRFIWFSTIIYMIYYLFDRKEAVHWIGSISLFLFIAYFFDSESFALSVTDFLIWILNMFIVLMISHWYAKIEEESTERLLFIQNKLAEEVRKKTHELHARTKELEVLNERLEERVKEEVEKNRHQEQMLFRQARHAQMGEVLSMIAHQWRQPLNAVSSSITMMQASLRNDNCDKEKFMQKTKRVEGYVLHLSDTIDDFRNFFREDKEKCELSLDGVVNNALELMSPLLQEERITVEIKKRCECNIYSYPNEILHVILNLLSNAKDALARTQSDVKRIWLATDYDDKYAYFEIEDNAGGIDETIKEKIFDPYFTTKEEEGGTGLGLYMAKVIIERHCQGILEVENRDQGAYFKITFPKGIQEDMPKAS